MPSIPFIDLQAQRRRLNPPVVHPVAVIHPETGRRALFVNPQSTTRIVDLSEGSRQPLSNEDGSIWVTFNGEIYNHAELRARLESLYGARARMTIEDTQPGTMVTLALPIGLTP